MLESELKRKGRLRLEKWGWIVIHLIQTNTNGIPDTMILRKSKIYFIEFKQPGEIPDDLQKYRIRKLREQGFETLVRERLQDKNRTKEALVYWVFSEGGIESKIYERVLEKKDYTLSHFKRDYKIKNEYAH